MKVKHFFLLLATLLFITTPCVAAISEWHASIGMQTFYIDGDDGTSSTRELTWSLQEDTALGADFEVSDTVYGAIELEIGDGVELESAYGVWNFGPGVLLIGQDSAPFDWGPDQVAAENNDLEGFGALTIDEAPQISVQMNNGLYLTLLDNSNDNIDTDDIEFPLVAAGINGERSNTVYGAGVAFVTYEKADNRDADTWLAYAQIEQGLGTVDLLAKVYYGENLGELAGYAGPSAMFDEINDEDAETFAGFLAITGQINDKVAYGAGIGYASTDRDDFSDPDAQLTYYIQTPIQVAKGFQVVPSVAVFDFLDDSTGSDEGHELYVGAKWQFDF